MSDMYIERPRNAADVVVMEDVTDDPVVEVVEPEGGVDHFAPNAESITHILSHSAGRTDNPWLEALSDEQRTNVFDPDSAFETGTAAYPDREVHDEALQTRELAPTSWSPGQVPLPIQDAPILIVGAHRERMSVPLYNAGTVTVYLLPRNTGLGFPLVPGASFSFSCLSGIYGYVGSQAAATGLIAYADFFRSDNKGH